MKTEKDQIALVETLIDGVSKETRDKFQGRAAALVINTIPVTVEMQALLEEMGSDSNISKVKRLAGKSWDAARKAGDNAYKAISEFFLDIAQLFKDLGTKISKYVGDVFEKLSETVKTLAARVGLHKEVKQVRTSLESLDLQGYKGKDSTRLSATTAVPNKSGSKSI
jgi:hypothetical protein